MAIKTVNAMIYSQLSDEAKKLYRVDDSKSGKDSVKTVTSSRLYQSGRSSRSSSSSSSSYSNPTPVQTVTPVQAVTNVDVGETVLNAFDGYGDLVAEKFETYARGNEKPSQTMIVGGVLLLMAILFR